MADEEPTPRKYERGSLHTRELILLILTWATEVVFVIGPIVNDKWYERMAWWPAVIGFFCATWLTRVLILGED